MGIPPHQNADCITAKNAFMNCLPSLNIYALLTVDLLHEFELGVWKAVFTHIVRILSIHPGAVDELDKRYAPAHLNTNLHSCSLGPDSALLVHLERTPSVGFRTMHPK